MSTSAHSNLQKMADQTGGEYYYSASGNELTKVLGDGDGLYDIYERSGMKLPNGQVVYTDATSVDTDGDGLTDFQEIGIVFKVDDRYIGNFMTKEIKYFVMNSDPTQKDTDDDGITDDKDTSPWKADSISINLSSNSGYVHTITGTSANMHDVSETANLIREDDEVIYGDSGYLGAVNQPSIKEDEKKSRIEFRINRRPSSLKMANDFKGLNWDKVKNLLVFIKT